MNAAQKKAFVERMRKARGIGKGGPGASRTEIVIAQPSAPARRAVTYLGAPPPAPKKSLARRIGSAAVVTAVQEKELLASLITAGAIAYADQTGWLADLPEIDAVPIGKKGTLALISYAAAKWVIKDPELKKIAMGITTAAATISTYELIKAWTAKQQLEGALKGSGAGDDGDDDEAGV